jgi:hypothetical protein
LTSSGFGRERIEVDRRTAASAHKRIDDLEKQLVKHEAVSTERWTETILRIKRIEAIMIGTAGATIMLLITLLTKTG